MTNNTNPQPPICANSDCTKHSIHHSGLCGHHERIRLSQPPDGDDELESDIDYEVKSAFEAGVNAYRLPDKAYLAEKDSVRLERSGKIMQAIRTKYISRERVAKALEQHLQGIDRDEAEAPDGWWETSTGAVFGAKRLEQLRRELGLQGGIDDHLRSSSK